MPREVKLSIQVDAKPSSQQSFPRSSRQSSQRNSRRSFRPSLRLSSQRSSQENSYKKKSYEIKSKISSLHSKFNFPKTQSRFSRIKFKKESTSSYSRLVSHDFPSQLVEHHSMSKKHDHKKSTVTNKTRSQEEEEILNPAICQHRNCCFAYNMTNDVKNSTQLADCLPNSIYQKLSEIWHLEPLKQSRIFGNICKLQQFNDEEDEMVEEFIRSVERDLGILRNASQDLQVNIGSKESSTSVTEEGTKKKGKNPYLRFLKKLDTLNNKEVYSKQLKKKAGKITKSIIKNFLEWYQSLGGNDGETLIEDFTLQELFQIGFDLPAAKTMGIKIKELPTVPECLATLMNDKMHSTRYQLKQLIKEDIKLEKRPLKMFAFGSMLPKEHPPLRYMPPQNAVQKTWMECSRVPPDLDSMKTVWGGLERLRSTIAFANWLKSHPDITPPKYLLDKGILEINYEEWNQMFKGFEPDLGTLESEIETSESKLQEKSSVNDASSSSSTVKYESYDSFI